jgi:hypothetical protein
MRLRLFGGHRGTGFAGPLVSPLEGESSYTK